MTITKCMLLAALSLALSGCAAAGSTKTEVVPTTTLAPSPAGRVLPLERYLLSDPQALLLARARVVVVNRCFARKGIAERMAWPEPDPAAPTSLTDRRYGITDAELATRFAYGFGSVQRRDGTEGRPLSDAARAALLGEDETPGCMAEAEAAVRRGVPAGVDIYSGSAAQFESFALVKKDPAVIEVNRKWSQCMKRHAIIADDPLTIMSDRKYARGIHDAPAVAAALTDIECKRAVGLVEVWFERETRHQNAIIERDGERFGRLDIALRRVVANCQVLVQSRSAAES